MSAELEVAAEYCAEGKVLTRTVADDEGTSAKTRGAIAKKSRTMAKARIVAATRRVWRQRRLVGGGRCELIS